MTPYMSKHAYTRAWSRMAKFQVYINNQEQLMALFQKAMERSTFFPFAKEPRSYKCVDQGLTYIFYSDINRGCLALATVYPVKKKRTA